MRKLSSYSAFTIAFARRYVEALFDRLYREFAGSGLKSTWWLHLQTELEQAVRLREAGIWATVGNGGSPPHHVFLKSVDPGVLDEGIWQIARHLKGLYETIGWDEVTAVPDASADLIELPQDRYLIDLAATGLPGIGATSRVSSWDWDSILRDLSRVAYVDFLLASAQVADGGLRLKELFARHAGDIVGGLRHRRPESTIDVQVVHRAIDRLATDTAAMFDRRIDESTLKVVDEALAILLSALTPEVAGTIEALGRQLREDLLEDLFISVIEAGAPQGDDRSDDDLFSEYLHSGERRRDFENSATQIVSARLIPRAYEVVLPITASVDRIEWSTKGGLTLGQDFPVGGASKPPASSLFAHVIDLTATSEAHAVHQAWRRTEVALSMVGLLSDSELRFEVLSAYYREQSAAGWGYMGRKATRPRTSSFDIAWSGIATHLHSVMDAGDDLALRIQESVIHLHRAGLAADPEDQLDEAWKVLELISKCAEAEAESFLSYLPLYFYRKDFGALSEPDKMSLLTEKYERTRTALRSVREARNKALVHRRLVRANWLVLGHHAVWTTVFAKQVVFAATLGWSAGARRVEDVKVKLEEAYVQRFQCRLPERRRRQGKGTRSTRSGR